MSLAALALVASLLGEQPWLHALRTELHRAELVAWSAQKSEGYVACVACEEEEAP